MRVSIFKLPLIYKIVSNESAFALGSWQGSDIIFDWSVIDSFIRVDDKGCVGVDVVLVDVSWYY